MTHIALVVLTHNSAQTLPRCLASAREIVKSILVVDSGSADESLQIAERMGARALYRPFVNYADQRNWAAAQIDQTAECLLHLDSDEYLTTDLAAELAERVATMAPSTAGFLMRRRVIFCGREMRHGGLGGTWHLRLYRVGRGRCEDRLYDQHFVSDGAVDQLHGFFVDDNRSSLELWTESHNRWSTAEAREILTATDGGTRVTPTLLGTPIQRKRWMKERVWARMPPFWRALAYFLYRYVIRLGFLDGTEGLIFHTLQGFWFRFLVDSKLWEARARQISHD